MALKRLLVVQTILSMFLVFLLDSCNGVTLSASRRPTIPLSMWKNMDGMSTSRFMDQFLVQGPRNDTANRPPAEGSIQESEASDWPEIPSMFPPGGASPNHHPIPGDAEEIDLENSESIFTESGSVDPEARDAVAGMVGEPSGCEPQSTQMTLIDENDPSILYWPSCVRVMRCGGCCGHDMLACKPTLEEIVLVEVMKMQYPYAGATDFVYLGVEQYPVTSHLQCECNCRNEPSHCHEEKHTYNSDACSCECVNQLDYLNCPSHKIWDHRTCDCHCPQLTWCDMDSYYSNDTCSCEHREEVTRPVLTTQVSNIDLDPCASYYCRQGLVPVYVRGQCRCQRVRRRSPALPRSASSMVRVPDHPMFHYMQRKGLRP